MTTKPIRERLDRLRDRAAEGGADPDHGRVYGLIAAEVVEQRAARGLSQRELAELCGTTQSAIARLESGRRAPRIDTLLRVANALDCELHVALRPRTTTGGNP
jgi:ribosome-binding protein aMBF1 (putative translation factor)